MVKNRIASNRKVKKSLQPYEWNQGFNYILLVIDTFSKYVWLQPLNYKTDENITQAFQNIFKSSKRSPAKLITDKGNFLL